MKKYIYSGIALLLLMVSCGTPNSPEDYTGGYKIVHKMTTPGAANDIIIDGDYAYMAQGEGGLLIVDLSQPDRPVVKTMLNEGVRGYSTKITKKGNTVYLTAGSFGVSVVNVSDVDSPVTTVSNLAIKPSKNVRIMGDYLLAAIGERGFKLAYLGNPDVPDIRGETNTDGYARDAIANDALTRVMVATGEVGFALYDITNFDDGYGIYDIKGSCDLPGISEFIALDETNSTAYIACGSAGLAIVDYTDEAQPQVVSVFDTGGYAKEVIYNAGKAYVTTGQGGLHIIDVHDPFNPKEIGIIDTEKALGLTMKGDYIYIADAVEGLIVVAKP